MAECPECNGSGRQSCGVCWGGQRQILCMGCSGRGYIKHEDGTKETCKRCNGAKFYIPLSCPKCDNSIPCPHCGGTGKI